MELTCDHANSTTMLHLFEPNSFDYWCRFEIDTVWSFVAGDPLNIMTYSDADGSASYLLGSDFAAGQLPVLHVPRGTWRRPQCKGAWSLATCVYTPGFEYEHLQIADPEWAPGKGEPKLIFPGEKWDVTSLTQ